MKIVSRDTLDRTLQDVHSLNIELKDEISRIKKELGIVKTSKKNKFQKIEIKNLNIRLAKSQTPDKKNK